MSHTPWHLDDDALKLLVFGDEDSQEYRATATHVESCQVCQHRLSEWACTQEDEQEIGALLSSVTDMHGQDLTYDSVPADALPHSKQLDFLTPPRHPELLGRLGRYDVERVIGAGGMGIVLKAHDTELNRPVAIKVLARHLAHSGAARQRFARESRAAAAVVHEHTVAIHNVETECEVPFLVMQYVAGESLQERVDGRGPLQTKEILRIGLQLASGLSAAHQQGVIHRDIKPANILLEAGVERALLTDFGLARTVDDASLTRTGIVTGTPHYMSPEQAHGDTADHTTDLFSLGSVLYFMATGRPPFRAERAMGVLHRICNDRQRPVWDVNPDIPDELSDVIDRLLRKKPTRRFRSADEVHQALGRGLAAIQNKPRRNRIRRLLRRHPRICGMAVTVAGVLLVAPGIMGNLPVQRAAPPTREHKSLAPAIPSAVEIIRQAASSEMDQYRRALQVIDGELVALERDATDSHFISQTNASWSQEIASLHTRLDRIEEPTFSSDNTTTQGDNP